MSQTATQFDIRQNLIVQLRRAAQLLTTDLGHIPKDKQNLSPMGCARAPLAVVAECAGLNQMAAQMLRNEKVEMPGHDEIQEITAQFDTFEKATSFLAQATEQLVQAIEALDEEALHTPAQAPWGGETTFYNFASLCASHMMYHDGQLNYIQCLYGDDKFHWAEE